MDNTKWFCETGSECHTLKEEFIKAYNGKIYPATKDQRDLLFQKMKESGYEWNDEKKELKKIEQKPDTDFSDLRTWKYIVDAVWTEKEGIGQYLDSPFTEEVAKKLQKRFGNVEQKPIQWDLVDVRAASLIRDAINGMKLTDEARFIALNWLKSLKDRYTWKPTKEQMEVLAWCKPLFADPKSKGILESLINDLKKLKG